MSSIFSKFIAFPIILLLIHLYFLQVGLALSSKMQAFVRMKPGGLFDKLNIFFYLRYWKAFLMEHSYYGTVHSTTICSQWVFVDTPEHTTQGLNNGSTNIASTNQVTILSAQQVFATCYSITPVQSNACIMNRFCWNHCTELIQCPYRISVVQQSVVRQLFKE